VYYCSAWDGSLTTQLF
nr:immunoglobulin light chain junction region [Macaca mulatta]MOV95757.1 immunoglobulin light chain junction region [Macaca mulatta]MOV96742.1 immunoglobulin light chain junction region [Macaca mulatta]MOV97228.1 immunoglobulin light chain junction region [Macaca mulatta]MOV98821.1 immunoglobulin light chain junction region [Macaca mulatta]